MSRAAPATAIAGFGWVVDDGGPAKREAGGPAEFARKLSEGAAAPCNPETCPTCKLLDEKLGCVGVIEPPISPAAERWLAERLPASIDSLPGQLLRQNLTEGGVTGAGGEALRRAGMMAAPRPFAKNYGPFFRGYTVTTDQILEEILCAGDIQPAHALAILVHLGAIAIDGVVPLAPADGARLADIVNDTGGRVQRCLCTVRLDIEAAHGHVPGATPGSRGIGGAEPRKRRAPHGPPGTIDAEADDQSAVQMKRLVRALFAAFVQDTELRVLGGRILAAGSGDAPGPCGSATIGS